MVQRLSVIAVFYTAKQKKRKKICICAIFVVPLHPIVHIWTEKMNIREIIKEVEYIYYFSGGVAFFRAKDEKGSYQGLIDRDGEIVWDIKWRTPALRLSAFPYVAASRDATTS